EPAFGLFWSAVLPHRFGSFLECGAPAPLWMGGYANPKDPKRCGSTALHSTPFGSAVVATALDCWRFIQSGGNHRTPQRPLSASPTVSPAPAIAADHLRGSSSPAF